MRRYLFAAALCVVHTSLLAQNTDPNGSARQVSFLLGTGLTSGGDTLATATFTDGSTSTIKAGNLFFLKVGADWRVNPNVSLQGAFGFHTDAANAKNADLKFNRNFIEGLAFWNTTPTQRVGLGVRQTFDAKLTSGGAAASVGNYDFTGKLGAVLEYEWRFSPGTRGYGLTVRYVAEKYTPTKLNGQTFTGPDVDGSHLGVGFNFYF